MPHTDIAHRRLLNQRIAGEPCGSPEEVVRWMGAMQAQEYQQAIWAIGLRMRSATRSEIEAAILTRTIVQTWLMRGTLHVVAAEDVKWMLELVAPRRLAADRARLKQLELDERILERCSHLFRTALQGGQPVPRSSLMQRLLDADISPAGQRDYHILWYLAQTGLLCLGPRLGKEQTVVLLDEWVPHPRQLSREAALAELAGRYFASHGPATLDDFATWTGLTLADARTGLESAQSRLVSEKHGTKVFWQAPNAPEPPTPALSTSVCLLPGFDEYLLGYKDRSAVLAPEYARNIVPGGNGIFLPMLVVGGQVVGTWKQALKKHAVEVTLIPFTPLGVSNAEISAAAERFSDFIRLPLAAIARQDEEHNSSSALGLADGVL